MEITMMETTVLILDTGMIMIILILVDIMATISLAVMILGMVDSVICMDMVRIIMDSTRVLMIFQLSMVLSMVLRRPLMGMDLTMQIATTSILTTMVSIITFMLITELATIQSIMILIIWVDTINIVSITASMVLIISQVMIHMALVTLQVTISMV